MARVITLGSATQDIFLLRPNESQIRRYVVDHSVCLTEGSKNEIEKIHYAMGGGAINAAVALHRLGHEVAPGCVIGDDTVGAWIVQELRTQKISTRAIFTSNEYSTGVSCIITCAGCESIVLVCRGANNHIAYNFTRIIRDEKEIMTAPFWYCGPMVGEAAIEFTTFLGMIRPYATTIAVNPGAFQVGVGCEYFKAALASIDIIMCNTREARMLAEHCDDGKTFQVMVHGHYEYESIPSLMHNFYQQQTIVQFAVRMMQYGPSIMVITDGAHGVYVIDKHHVYFHPATSLNYSNTVGAGDAFSSTFFGYLIEGETLASALSRAMLNSAAVLQSCDANSGLLSRQDLQQRYERQGTGNVQEFAYEIVEPALPEFSRKL